MAVKRGRECGSDGGEVEYEKLRNERLRENQKRMEELGILSLSKSLSESVRGPGHSSGRGRSRTSPSSAPRATVPTGPARRSSRLSGTPVVSYSEGRRYPEGKEKSAGRKAQQAGTGGFRPEIYTEEDEKLLGTAKNEWRLFVDGYVDGTRVYDPVRGKTCHQCRQKTMGRRTSCSNCQSLHGQFCGDCLYMRYGENVVETNENENWECPVCRGICNCSFCRLKRGWTPTGSLYRKIKSLGYESVAHYLILTRREGQAVGDKEADGKKTTLKLELDELKTPTSAPKLEELKTPTLAPKLEELKTPTSAPKLEDTDGEALPTSLVKPKKESEMREKVPEIQSTLLSAGWRSRRGVSTGSKEGEKPMNPNSSKRQPNVAASEINAEEPPRQKRRGRPPKNRLSGKVAFYASAPKARLNAKPEPVDEELPGRILVLDSDTEDSSDRHNFTPETIAHRLRRRVTS